MFRERPVETSQAIAAAAARRRAQVPSPGPGFKTLGRERAVPGRLPPRKVNAGSVEGQHVTVHSVRLGSKVHTIKVAKCAAVQVGDGNRQLNNYRFRVDRPRVSLDRVLEGHPDRMRALAKVAANPRSWMANHAFRQKLSARPEHPSGNVLFSGTSPVATVRISARVDEHGAMVVENSRGVQAGDNNTQRSNFSFRTVGHQLPLEQMLHDRPELVRALAVAVRYPGNPAVQRTFARQASREFVRGSGPSLRVLSQDWARPGLSVEHAVGLQVGNGNRRTDKVSLKVGRLVMTGWDSSVKHIAAKIDQPAITVEPAIVPDLAKRPPLPGISLF